jgi:hypothetical protein
MSATWLNTNQMILTIKDISKTDTTSQITTGCDKAFYTNPTQFYGSNFGQNSLNLKHNSVISQTNSADNLFIYTISTWTYSNQFEKDMTAKYR